MGVILGRMIYGREELGVISNVREDGIWESVEEMDG